MADSRNRYASCFISTASLLLIWSAASAFHSLAIASAADAPQSSEKMDEQRLIGRWVRPDGGYVLELKEIGKDGTLTAAYFNPRSINIAQALIRRDNGAISLFVELRDVNYPGSTYNLRYDSKTDRLSGTYFQAVYGQTYSVEFFRGK